MKLRNLLRRLIIVIPRVNITRRQKVYAQLTVTRLSTPALVSSSVSNYSSVSKTQSKQTYETSTGDLQYVCLVSNLVTLVHSALKRAAMLLDVRR